MNRLSCPKGVLARTAASLPVPDREQLQGPTSCPNYDVSGLMDHMVGCLQVFAAGPQGRVFQGGPASYHCGTDLPAEFASRSQDLLAGWRQHGFERSTRLARGETPGQMAFDMTLIEYMTHGWDLAKASGQTIPFGGIVPVPAHAGPTDRSIGFMERKTPKSLRSVIESSHLYHGPKITLRGNQAGKIRSMQTSSSTKSKLQALTTSGNIFLPS